MDKKGLLNEENANPMHFEHPLLAGLILTIIYGLIVYFPDFLDLDQGLFRNPSPFESIMFEFASRFTLSGVLWLVILPSALYLMKRISLQDFIGSIRLNPNQISDRDILAGLIISFLFFICVMLSAIFLGLYSSNFSLLVSPDYENGLGWFIFIFALIPGIWEEIAFRGIIFSFLLTKLSARKALLFDSLLFSLFHVFNYLLLDQELFSVVLQSIAAIPVGLSLAYLVLKMDSILPVIMIHYTIDVTLFISGFVFDLSNTDSALIFASLSLIIIPSLLIFLSARLFNTESLAV